MAIGFYGSDSAFQAGAAAQVAYTFKRLGGDVLDIEIKAENVYNHYEEAAGVFTHSEPPSARNSLGVLWVVLQGHLITRVLSRN